MVARGGHIKGTVLISRTAVVGGVQVFEVAKGYSTLERLFGFVSHQKVRPLSKTNIIEKLQQLRDDEYIKFCGPKCENDDGNQLPTSVERLVPRIDMPEIVTIVPPSFDGIVAPPIQVALDRPRSNLRVELSTTSIEYLSKVCRYQVTVGHAVPQDQRVEASARGVSCVYAQANKGCSREMYKAGARQKVLTKFFSKKKNDNDEKMAGNASHKAVYFID